MSLCQSLCVLCLMLVGSALADTWQDTASYPSAPGWQYQGSYGPPAPTYSSGGGGGQPAKPCGSPTDFLSDIGSYKSTLLQTGASAAIAALLAKLPALIFLKVLIFKLIVVPMLFMFVAIPVLMPLLMMMMPMMMNMMNMMSGGDSMMTSTTTTTAAPMGRSRGGASVAELDEVLRNLLESHKCLERVACKLGAKDQKSVYKKPITWLLKQLQTLVPAGYRDRVKRYRQAYMEGAGGGQDVCDQLRFPCDTPQLLVQQDSRTFRIL